MMKTNVEINGNQLNGFHNISPKILVLMFIYFYFVLQDKKTIGIGNRIKETMTT
jgi:hypothetical protein